MDPVIMIMLFPYYYRIWPGGFHVHVTRNLDADISLRSFYRIGCSSRCGCRLKQGAFVTNEDNCAAFPCFGRDFGCRSWYCEIRPWWGVEVPVADFLYNIRFGIGIRIHHNPALVKSAAGYIMTVIRCDARYIYTTWKCRIPMQFCILCRRVYQYAPSRLFPHTPGLIWCQARKG